MKSKQRDTFLIGHARRMRKYRKQQRQQDPEAYANRIKTQQQEYRRRTRSAILSSNLATAKLESILNLRLTNRERQRRYRLNQSNEQNTLRKEKDRNRKRLKRKREQPNQSNNNDENSKST